MDNRGIDTFTPEECWRIFRFKKEDLNELKDRLLIPLLFEIKGGRNGHCSGEYALLYLLYRLQ